MKRAFELELARVVGEFLSAGLEQDRLILSLKGRVTFEECMREDRRIAERTYF